MAKFELQLPSEILKDFEKIYGSTDKIFGGMTKAGAKVAENLVRSNMPAKLKANNSFMQCLGLSSTYRTPTDDGINTQVMINGYFTNEKGQRTPAPLVANMFEYGSSRREYPKQPFFRKSFKKSQIERAMMDAQKRLSEGLLDD